MSLLSLGAVLRYETADDDATDTYCFQLLDTEGQLVISSAFEDDDPEAVVGFSAAALAGARTIAVLSQGSWLSSDLEQPTHDDESERLDADLPPFLISREMLRELRGGATELRPEWAPPGSRPQAVKLTGRTTAEIELDGETVEVPVLAARGDDIELRVVDDDEWPLVLERIEGDNFWRLLAVDHEDLSDDDDDEAEEDLPPPEPAGPLANTGQITGDQFVNLAQRLGVAGMDMDYEGSRFLLLDAERKIVIAANYKIVLVAMPGNILRRGHAFDRYIPSQVLEPLGAGDPIDVPGTLREGAAIAEALAKRAGADVLYPDALGPMYIALFNVQALAD